MAEKLRKLSGNEYGVVVLGHLQRGGSPTARDRVLATQLGAYAIEMLEQGRTGIMVGEVKGELVMTPFQETWKRRKELNPFLLTILPILAQ